MKWLELSVKAPPEFVEPLSQIFYRYGQGGVVLEVEGAFNPDEGEAPSATDWVTLKTYIPLNSAADGRRNRIDLGVRLVAHVSPVSPLQETVVEEEDWQHAWKEHFHVLRVGKRMVVSPTWREHKAKKSDIVVTLDPGMAFGTGHHPTTRMCLELLEKMVKPVMSVLDVGCGSGILSIAAAKLRARSVLGLEIDSVALGVAKQNVRENGVGHNIRIVQGSLPHPDVGPLSYDLAVANISAKVITEIAGELVRAVRPGGNVIASGILLDNSDAVAKALNSAGGLLNQTIADGDWVTLVVSIP